MLANGIQFIATHGQLLLKSVALLREGALRLALRMNMEPRFGGLP